MMKGSAILSNKDSLNSLDDIVILIDAQHKIIAFNSTAENFFGCSAAQAKHYEILGWLSNKNASPDFLTFVQETIQSKSLSPAFYKKIAFEMDHNIDWTITTLSTGIEIKGEKLLSEQERKSIDTLFQLLEERFPEGNYWWKNRNGVYQGCNEHVLKPFELKKSDIIGKTDYDLSWQPDPLSLIKNDEDVLRTGKTKRVEEFLVDKHGKVYTFSIIKSPLRNKKGIVVGTIALSFDISDRKKEEENLKRAKEEAEANSQEKTEFLQNMDMLFESLQDTMPGNYWWKDKNGVYLGCNKNAVSGLGLKPEEVIGKTDYDLPWDTDVKHVIEHDNEVMRTGQVQKIEESLIDENDKTRTFLVVKAPLKNKEGEIIGTVGTSFDITDRKEAEEALKIEKERAETASQVKTEFLENMRHDIRTPLTGIVGFAQLIKEEAQEPRIQDYAQNLVSSAESLLDFLNEILEAIRATSGEVPLLKKKFSLKEKIEDVLNLNQSKAGVKHIALKLNYDEKIPNYVIGDPRRIHRVILELVTNALNFTKQGSVTVTATLAKHVKHDIVVKITVQDTGIGIPEDKQDDIFTRFKRLSPSYEGTYKGAGLGLAVVKQFMDDLNGELYVDSKPNVGTTFTCLFSLKETLLNDAEGADLTPSSKKTTVQFPQALNEVSPPNATDGHAHGQTSILLVEDHHIAAGVAKALLLKLNCNVDIAEDGFVALEKFNANTYDLIFMDVGLPGMDGCRTTKEIRLKESAQGTHIPILALTAHVDAESKQRCLHAGMDAVLSKPLTREKAEELLNAFIPQRLNPPLIVETEETPAASVENNSIDLKLGSQLLGNQPEEVAIEMIDLLVKGFTKDYAEFDQAHKTKDWKALQGLAHRMKGGACYCGTPRLKEISEQLERCLAKNDYITGESLYKKLLAEMKSVEKAYISLKKKR